MAKNVPVPGRAKQHLRRWYGEQLLEKATVLQGSFFGWLFGRFGQSAVTLNKTVHFTPRAPELESDSGIVLLGHECYHILQQHEMGWWNFLLGYLIRWRPSHIRRGGSIPSRSRPTLADVRSARRCGSDSRHRCSSGPG